MTGSSLATPYKYQSFGYHAWNDRGGTIIDTVAVHHAATTSMPDVWKNGQASAHYGIGKDRATRQRW